MLHAVIFSIAPETRVIDLDHSVPAGDVRLGALRLERMLRYLPVGIHVAVVDPGVGGVRAAVAVEAGGRIFVGPDNGLLIWGVEAAGGPAAAVRIEDEGVLLADRARTFDGRDVFAPAAAHLARGRALADLGPPLEFASLVTLERPSAVITETGAARLEVLQVDGFGNVQLAAGGETARRLGWQEGELIEVAGGAPETAIARYVATYGDVAPGALLLLVDADGCLALSVNGDRADVGLGVGRGETLELRRPARGARFD